MRRRKDKKKIGMIPQIFFYILVLLIAIVTYNTSNPFSDSIPNWYTLTGQEIEQEDDIILNDLPLNEYATVTEDYEASVHVIDIGQGNCTLILSDGEAMLIDGGDNGTQDIIIEYLELMGVDSLKYIVATHPHADHIGSIDDVLNSIEVENIIMPEIPSDIIPTSKTYERMLVAIDDSGVEVIKATPNTQYILGGSIFHVLSPMDEYGDLNNMSAAIRFVHNESEILIAGDIEKEAEEDILESGQNLDSDVLLLGHHGSNTSSTIEFLEAVNAKFYVAQVGYDNEFGHPHAEVYERCMEFSDNFYRSDVDGHVIFGLNANEISVITQK